MAELLLTLPLMARRLRVPRRWLKEQAQSGSVPSLAAGNNRFLFSPEAVEASLAKLAAAQSVETASEVSHH